jgi:hypothetical protein
MFGTSFRCSAKRPVLGNARVIREIILYMYACMYVRVCVCVCVCVYQSNDLSYLREFARCYGTVILSTTLFVFISHVRPK